MVSGPKKKVPLYTLSRHVFTEGIEEARGFTCVENGCVDLSRSCCTFAWLVVRSAASLVKTKTIRPTIGWSIHETVLKRLNCKFVNVQDEKSPNNKIGDLFSVSKIANPTIFPSTFIVYFWKKTVALFINFFPLCCYPPIEDFRQRSLARVE